MVDNPDDKMEETMDALLEEALKDFEQCRAQLDKIQRRKHEGIEVSSSTSALKKI